MAQPYNTFDTTDSIGNREDLQDIIYSVTPYETPLLSSLSRGKAANDFHEWQTDALAAPNADNAHINGNDIVAEAITPTIRIGNYTQTFTKTVRISDDMDSTNRAGRGSEMAYQLQKRGRELKTDIESAIFANQARVANTSTTGGRLAGIPAWLATNTSAGSGGSDATLVDGWTNGATARTDGTQRAFTQALFDVVRKSIWDEGGMADTVYLSSFQKQAATTDFSGPNSQRAVINIPADGRRARVSNTMQVYVDDFGEVEFVMSRHIRGRDVLILDESMWSVAIKRPMQTKELARTGDSTAKYMLTQLTLCAKNEKSSGGVFDCSTS